jgi:hypothetical protein
MSVLVDALREVIAERERGIDLANDVGGEMKSVD